MKKVLIKVLSVLLVVTIFATLLPFSTLAAEENSNDGHNVSTDMGDMSMTATNSFGEMLMESLSEKTDEQNAGYYIYNIEYEGYCALVSFVTQQDCTIRVAVYEEDTGRMVTTASADVLATDTETIVEFEDELPDYFVLKAFMLDENVAPLCKAYTCNEMTKMYEDFMAKTTDDYPAEKVINLDEDKTNNFLVMSEDTTTVTTDGRTNVLVSYDEETGVYTFGNIDNQIKSLKKDDIFYYDNGSVEELTFIKVGAIKINGTTAEITKTGTAIEEIFEVVKIDNEISTSEFEYSEENSDDVDVIYLGREEKTNSTKRSLYKKEPTTAEGKIWSHKFNFKPKVAGMDPEVLSPGELKIEIGDVTLGSDFDFEGSLTITLNGAISYLFEWTSGLEEFEFSLTPVFEFFTTITGVGRAEVELGEFQVANFYGFGIAFSPIVIFELSGTITFDSKMETTFGIRYDNKEFFNTSKKPSFDAEFTVEGYMYVGLGISPSISFVDDDILEASLTFEAGPKVIAKKTVNSNGYHLCGFDCIDGEIKMYMAVSGALTFANLCEYLKREYPVEIGNIEVGVWDFYYSKTYSEFGWGDCPYYEVVSGKCGRNLTWTFYSLTGTLEISGTGAMDDVVINKCPWEKYKDDIKVVIISNGVTSIVKSAFANCNNLTDVNYLGTWQEWKEISIDEGNDPILNAIIHFNGNMVKFNEHYYIIFDEGLTWEQAKKQCVDMGGHLVTITSKEENTVAERLLTKGNKNSYWLGGERTSNSWQWITGEVWGPYDNWSRSQPDNLGRNEDKLMVYKNDNPKRGGKPHFGQWNDLNGDGTCGSEPFFGLENFGYICEWDDETQIDEKVLKNKIDSQTNIDTIDSYSVGITYSLNSNQVSMQTFAISDTTYLTEYSASTSNAIVGNEYIIIVLNISAKISDFTENELLYIDQKTAETDDIAFNYIPKTDDESIVYIIGIFANADSVKQEIIMPNEVCKHTSTETIDGYASTCTTTGLTDGIKCSSCGEILTIQQEIPALGHSYETVVTAPSCTENGYTTYTCSTCGDIYTSDEVSALGHSPANIVEENYVAPSCTANGSVDKVVYCSGCNEELSRTTEIIEMLGHADNDGNGYCDADNELLDPTVECDCNCHKSGIQNFFFKFALFFQKLFGANKTCDCGVAHY